jgi:hypothetical protein
MNDIWLSWLMCALSVGSATAAAWCADPKSPQRLVASAINVIVAVLALVAGARMARRVRALESGRYSRISPVAWRRVASHLDAHNCQTVANPGARVGRHPRGGCGTPWGAGRGILITYATFAAPVAKALIESVAVEGLPAAGDGDSTTGFSVHIAFRRP